MPEPKRLTRIYFIQPIQGGLIKIGKADDPERRLRDLQIGSPVRLRLCAHFEADPFMETRLHLLFSMWREHGEWFRPHPVLAALGNCLPDEALSSQPVVRGLEFCQDVTNARKPDREPKRSWWPAPVDHDDPQHWRPSNSELLTAIPEDMDHPQDWEHSSAAT